VALDTGGGPLGDYDAVLWATGRVPNSDGLGLEAAGVATDDRGHVPVDDWQDTNVPGIHAVGDITGRRALTPVATGAGRRLAERLFGGRPSARLDYSVIPSVLFAEPPLGMAGLTETEARERHGDAVRVFRQRFVAMQLAVAGRVAPSVMKLVCVGEDERVVGIHALGPGADEMLQGFAVAMRLGLRRMDLQETIAIHPSSAEELLLPR
jgi:glutathione reductase (NADPH)